MNSATLKPNVQELQKDVIDLLRQISALMNRASRALSAEETGGKYAEFQKQVAEEASKVENLELTMAIVAPMKAGKSTIINAIIGQDLLPSRNAAMTTLPTQIVFNAELTKPALTLSEEILLVFSKTLEALRQKIQTSEPDWIQEKIAQYPHLVDLLQKIQAPEELPISAQTSGFEEIKNTLTDLNDIIRLCSLLEPSKDSLSQLVNLPRIETPFWRSPGIAQPEKIGNLVIVDTPGPNEAGEHLKLTAVVAEQLRQSSIVLIVLDFTQLKTKAAEEVKQDVQKVIELRGKENLYVLINKIDQRIDNDMTPEQVRQFVTGEFGIGDSADKERVFEIAARRAFYATNFRLEHQEHPGIDIAEMKTAQALAKQAFGDMWEVIFKSASVDQMESAAQSVWEKSGFAPFLDKAINALVESAAPRCMRSALNLSRSHLVKLRNQALIRTSDIANDAEELQRQVEAIDEDLNHLELCCSRLQQVNTIKVQLQTTLNDELKLLKEKAIVSLDDYFVEEEFKQAEEWQEKIGIGLRKFWEIFKGKNYNKRGLLEFKTDQEAEDFIAQAIASAKQEVERLLEACRAKATKQVEQSCQKLLIFLNQETKGILERARTRLNKAFNIDLTPVPIPDWKTEDFSIAKTKRQTREKTEYQTKKYRPWWLLWLIELEEEVPYTKTETYYTVSLEELVAKINQSIEMSLEKISQGINQYLEEDFQQRFDNFFKDLDGYLSNYRDSLKQAQKDQKLKAEEKDKLVNELKSLVPDATEKIKRADAYLERTNHLIVDK